ncbi:extracellular matrix protein 1 [Rhineura floridana]|uniref:extracellular matrix protein 1 n=1 Tax=Rhineura floridana TaxID=261503 RepID=UPI002AC81766|nr:extracellular matrix protein 1 [Rhineura floridana]
MKTLVAFLASWLVLAQSVTLAPKGDGGEKPPPPPSDDFLQEEIAPEQIPLEFLLQKPIDDELEGFDLPLLIHGVPQTRSSSPISPRGRRPSCSGTLGCTRDPPRYKLDEFPPALPSLANIGNICSEGRRKVSYGPWNLPQTGFSHLSRQGEALNDMEAKSGQCCQLSQDEKLPCCQRAWSDVLEEFCVREFMIKTRPFHCCKLSGPSWQRCFDNEAPFPNYDFNADSQASSEKKLVTCSNPSQCKPAELANPRKLPKISFPPGEPTSNNIKNICKLRKFRPTYPASALPQSDFSWLVRQAQAVNRMENMFKKCCRKDDTGCAHKGWENVLTQYCKQEFSVKTKPHFCCKETLGEPRNTCFSRLAPYPAYDKEIQQVNLGQISLTLLESLCGQFTLLTKQRNIPALVQNITEPCCKLQGDGRTLCAEEVKSQFITTLCSSQKNTWKDPKKCCSQAEDAARDNCFNLSYLSNVSLASAVEVPRPTEPAL